MIQWRFPSNDYGENKGINDSGVSLFKGTPLKSLAREICQNSLDASNGEKTIVEFNLFKVKSQDIPGRDELLDSFERCLQFWAGQKAKTTKNFFEDAIAALNGEECSVLRISDFNTKGLTGSKELINSDWTNLTKSSGASDKKGTAGGSYGIGKFAPFACSYLSTVYYSTYDINEERAYQGVARLVTFTREDGQNTQGTGYFGNEKNTPVFEELFLDPDFKRTSGQYGTDIFVAGYKYGGNEWQTELIVSIIDGFLGAIWDEKLEVIIGDIKINKSELGNIIEEYRDELTGYAGRYYEVLTSGETTWFEEDFLGLGEVKLGILVGEQDTPNRVSMIRQTGMKIMDKDRLPGHVPLMGVMFINGEKINEQLRLIENPEHTKWEPDRSANPIKAKQLIKALSDYIKDKIEDVINSGSDESIDAVGVGAFIPDDPDESKDSKLEEVVTDKVVDVEIKEMPKRSASDNVPGDDTSASPDTDPGHKEPGGDDTEWFHPGGETDNPGQRPGQEAHTEPGGKDKTREKINVSTEKLVCICVDKNAGKYSLKVVPGCDGINGEIELFLSAETQKYEAPLKNVSLIGGSVDFEGNKITGLEFVKNQEIRLSIEIDYNDYCSMEVMMHATAK